MAILEGRWGWWNLGRGIVSQEPLRLDGERRYGLAQFGHSLLSRQVPRDEQFPAVAARVPDSDIASPSQPEDGGYALHSLCTLKLHSYASAPRPPGTRLRLWEKEVNDPAISINQGTKVGGANRADLHHRAISPEMQPGASETSLRPVPAQFAPAVKAGAGVIKMILSAVRSADFRTLMRHDISIASVRVCGQAQGGA